MEFGSYANIINSQWVFNFIVDVLLADLPGSGSWKCVEIVFTRRNMF